MFGFMVIDLAQAIEADRRREARRAEPRIRRRSS
jgi:hypothetical protein